MDYNICIEAGHIFIRPGKNIFELIEQSDWSFSQIFIQFSTNKNNWVHSQSRDLCLKEIQCSAEISFHICLGLRSFLCAASAASSSSPWCFLRSIPMLRHTFPPASVMEVLSAMILKRNLISSMSTFLIIILFIFNKINKRNEETSITLSFNV